MRLVRCCPAVLASRVGRAAAARLSLSRTRAASAAAQQQQPSPPPPLPHMPAHDGPALAPPASSSLDGLRRASSDARFAARTAVVSASGASFTYGDLLAQAHSLADVLRGALQPGDDGATSPSPRPPPPLLLRREPGAGGLPRASSGPRVGVLAAPGPEYVAALWAAWLCGAVAVPLALAHPPSELRHVLDDASVAAVLVAAGPDAAAAAGSLRAAAGLCAAPPILLPMPDAHPGAAPGNPPPHSAASAPAPDVASAPPPAAAASEEELSTGALIIYTSGTTGRPKGALHTHGSLGAQVASLVGAWEWCEGDVIVHPLPLHHIHGIVNALLCPLAVGATVEFVPKFSPGALWARLRRGGVSVFMGVPTMYVRLLQSLDGMQGGGGGGDGADGDGGPDAEPQPSLRRASAEAGGRLRLAVSGSAACPLPVLSAWRAATGSGLLERYGMTETGMALSQPLRGARRPGCVGAPLPGVRARIRPDDDDGHRGAAGPAAAADDDAAADAGGGGGGGDGGPAGPAAAAAAADVVVEGPGELLVAGPALFAGYWGQPAATAAAFTADGALFRTGDTVAVVAGGGGGGGGGGGAPAFRVLGRTSVDIIKCGGYKLSALEIEAALLGHPGVGEAAVLGLPDEAYGQVVAAVLAGRGGAPPPTRGELRLWARDVLAPYKVPTVVRAVEALPRNAMGKTNKKQLALLFDDAAGPGPEAAPPAPP